MEEKVLYSDEQLSGWVDYMLSRGSDQDGAFVAELVGDISHQEAVPLYLDGDEIDGDPRYIEKEDIYITNPLYKDQVDKFLIYSPTGDGGLKLVLESRPSGIRLFIPNEATRGMDNFKEALLLFCKEIVQKSAVKFPKKKEDD